MKKDSSISLCMIVKDEENNIKNCLESVYKYVDEIIIVDTGSRDNTLSIAKNYQVTIIKESWYDDFSRARNTSLEHAQGDWILYLDADEYLPEKTVKKLSELSKNKIASAWLFSIISPINDNTANRHANIRMFRNKKNYFFQGKIHEQIKPSIIKNDPEAVILNSGLDIYHSGYRNDYRGRKAKTLRNIRILKQELKKREKNPFLNFNIAKSYYVLGKYQLSQKHYQIAVENIDDHSDIRPVLYRNYSLCLIETGEFKVAISLLKKAVLEYEDYPDLYFIMAHIYWDLGWIKEAKKYYNLCLNIKKISIKYTTSPGVNTFLALENIGEICLRENNIKKATKYFEKAYLSNKSFQLLVKILSCLQKILKKDKEIIQYFLKDDLKLSFTQMITLFYKSKNYNLCFEYYQIEEEKNNNQIKKITKKEIKKVSYYLADSMLRCHKFQEVKRFLEYNQEFLSPEKVLEISAIISFIDKPRKNIDNFLIKYKSKYIIHLAYSIVNKLIFTTNLETDFPQNYVDIEIVKKKQRLISKLKNIMFSVYDLGDKDLSITIARFISYISNEDYNYILAKVLIENKYEDEALFYFLQSLYRTSEYAEKYYYIGKIYEDKLQLQKAFKYYHKASQISNEEKYRLSALNCILKSRKTYINLILNNQNKYELQNTMLDIISAEKKISNLIRGLGNG
ncbi:glycosyltransferase [Natronospora cellulosivora (SeqCode)]